MWSLSKTIICTELAGSLQAGCGNCYLHVFIEFTIIRNSVDFLLLHVMIFLLALITARQRRGGRCFVVACGGINIKWGFLLWVTVRWESRGVFLILVLVFSSVQRRGDRGETSLRCGLRDRVNHRISGGARRYRGSRRGRRRGGNRGGSRWLHLQKKCWQ